MENHYSIHDKSNTMLEADAIPDVLPEYPAFEDDEPPPQRMLQSNKETEFENMSFSKLTELPNCTATQRSLIPQHLLDREKAKSSWLPFGIADAIQKAKIRGEKIANERRVAQGLLPLPLSDGSGPPVPKIAPEDLKPLEEPLPPSAWSLRGKPEPPIPLPEETSEEKPKVELPKGPARRTSVMPTPTSTPEEPEPAEKEDTRPRYSKKSRNPAMAEVKEETKPEIKTVDDKVRSIHDDLLAFDAAYGLDVTVHGSEKAKHDVPVPVEKSPVEAPSKKTLKEVAKEIPKQTAIKGLADAKDMPTQTLSKGLADAEERPKQTASKGLADASAAAAHIAADAKAKMTNWLGGMTKPRNDGSPEGSTHGPSPGGGLASLLQGVTAENVTAVDADDMSYGTAHTGKQPFGNPRRYMHRQTSNYSQHHMQLAPDELEAKERKPWRRQSELRRGSMMATNRKSTIGGPTGAVAAAAAAVAAMHFDDSSDSLDAGNGMTMKRGSLLGSSYAEEDESSTNSDVLYELPTDFERGHADPANFQDAWHEEHQTEAQEPDEDEVNKEYFNRMEHEVEAKMELGVLNIWGQVNSAGTTNAANPELDFFGSDPFSPGSDPFASRPNAFAAGEDPFAAGTDPFAAGAFPDNSMDTVKKGKKTKKKATEINDHMHVSVSSKISADPSEGSGSRKQRKVKKSEGVEESPGTSRRSSAESFDISELSNEQTLKKKGKVPESPSEIEKGSITEKKKGKTKKKKENHIADDNESAANSAAGEKQSEMTTKRKGRVDQDGFFFDNDASSNNMWPALKQPGRIQSVPLPQSQLGNKIPKRVSSAVEKQPLNLFKQGSGTSATSQTSDSTNPSAEESMLERLERQSRTSAMTSLFDAKPCTINANNSVNLGTLGSAKTLTTIRVSSSQSHVSDSTPVPTNVQELVLHEDSEKGAQKARGGRGIFGFGKKKTTGEHMSLDDNGSDDGAAFSDADDGNMDKPGEPAVGKFRRRISSGGTIPMAMTMPTMTMPTLFGGKKEEKGEEDQNGSKQPIRRGSLPGLSGVIQKQAPKSKTDSQPLMLERQTSGNWGTLGGNSSSNGMDLGALEGPEVESPVKKKAVKKGPPPAESDSLFAFYKQGKDPQSFMDAPSLARDDSEFRMNGGGSDGELDFNPRCDEKLGTKVGKNGKPRRSSSVPRERSSGLQEDGVFKMAKKKTDVEKSEKPSKPKRRKSVTGVDVPETPVVNKPKRRKSVSADNIPETPLSEKKKAKKDKEEVLPTPTDTKKKKDKQATSKATEKGEKSKEFKSEKSKSKDETSEKSKSKDDSKDEKKNKKKSKELSKSPMRLPSIPPPRVTTPPPAPLSGAPRRASTSPGDSDTKVNKKKTGRRTSS
jgi:hypothetical protein